MPVSINNTTLTFNDATTQTTSGVTSVSAGTGISVAGGKTPTITNTGVTSVTAGSGISVSASTGGVTISASGGGVTSLNGQTGAITTTDLNAIGLSGMYVYTGTSNLSAGSTVSGSNLRYVSNLTGTGCNYGGGFQIEGGAGVPRTSSVGGYGAYLYRTTGGNTGYTVPGGLTALSGTYRVLHNTVGGFGCYNGESETYGYSFFVPAVRVS
jgi:hypothetical protein